MYTMTPNWAAETLTVDRRAYEFSLRGGFGQADGVYVLDCETGQWTMVGRRGGMWEGGDVNALRQTLGTCQQSAPPRDPKQLRPWLRRLLRRD